MSAALSTRELAKTSGATYRQINRWAALGVLAPSNYARGSGFPDQWVAQDVFVCSALARLSRLGAETGVLGMVSGILSDWSVVSEWLYVAASGNTAYIGTDPPDDRDYWAIRLGGRA